MAATTSLGECSKKTNRTDILDEGRPLKKAKYIWQLKGKYHLKSTYAQKYKKDSDSESEEPEEPSLVNRTVNNDVESDEEPHIEKSIPVTLVTKHQDDYLHKWQARQVAKSFVDNTINSILEHWKIAPFDSDFVENCDNGGQVEDEGILMAIQSHGLHSNTNRIAESSSEREQEHHDDDFLNAAVSAAIQKNGLDCNYG